MKAPTGPDTEQQRIIETEALLGYHSVWKTAGTQNNKAGVFFPAIGTWDLAKELDARYQKLIDEAYQRGLAEGKNGAPY